MKTVLVTGAKGFIGKNLCANLKDNKEIKVLAFDRDNSEEELEEFLDQSEFIFHLAGVNRPQNEKEFDTGNRGLTEQIISSLKKKGKKTPILITSSIQAELNNPYGKSKKAAEKAVFDWAKSAGVKVYVYRLPNVFGKWCQPNYNSVVATFCNNIANNLEISINDSGKELNLVYVTDVIKDFLISLNGKKEVSKDGYCYIERVFKITLKELADKIYSFRDSRKTLKVPNFEDPFEKFLYATYLSYLPEGQFGYNLEMKHDERGWLAEFIKSAQFGQIFVSKTKPGITRGNHWHHTKVEKFLVLSGEAEIKFRDLNTNKISSYKVSEKELKVVDIPVGFTHSIKNIGKGELITIFWADEIFNPEEPDTYFEEV